MHRRRVLVVDDEMPQRTLFSRLLTAYGYIPLLASSGSEALAVVRDASPNLILIDISMPGIDGIQLLLALRASPTSRRTPIILMTGLPVPDSMLTAVSDGIGECPVFKKGADLNELIRSINTATRKSQHRVNGDYPDIPIRLLRRGCLAVDPENHRVWIGETELHKLPSRRFELLCALLRFEEPQNRQVLLKALWHHSDSPNIVDVNILRLRNDLLHFPNIRIDATPTGYRLIVASPASTPPSDKM